MKRPDQLANFVEADDDNFFGRIKDTLYSAPQVIAEVGSKVLADWIMDLLSIIYFIAKKKNITLNGVADNTSICQAYDILFGEVSDYNDAKTDPIARQLSLSSWRRESSANSGIGVNTPQGEKYEAADNKDLRHAFLYVRALGAGGGVHVTLFENGVLLGDNLVILDESIPGDPWALIANSNKFVATTYEGDAGNPVVAHTSTNGETWVQSTVDADTARTGGYVLAKVGDTIYLLAYNDPDNSIYTSTDNGTSWTRTSQTSTPTKYKPVAAASSGTTIFSVDENPTPARYFDGTQWGDATINGGALTTSFDKQVVFGGSRYLVRDNQATLFLSDENDPTVLTAIAPPRPAETPTLIMGGDGVFGVVYGGELYVATENNAVVGLWELQANIPEGVSTNYYAQVQSFDGRKHCTAGPEENGNFQSVLIGSSTPLQL
jgi:hypothetical protein